MSTQLRLPTLPRERRIAGNLALNVETDLQWSARTPSYSAAPGKPLPPRHSQMLAPWNLFKADTVTTQLHETWPLS